MTEKKIIAVVGATGQQGGGLARDIGRTAYAIFKAGREQVDRTVHLSGEHRTGEQFAAAFTKLFGEPVVYRPMSHDAYRALGFPGAEEIGTMFQYFTEAAGKFAGARDVAKVRRLNPGLQGFDAWLAEHGDAIPRP